MDHRAENSWSGAELALGKSGLFCYHCICAVIIINNRKDTLVEEQQPAEQSQEMILQSIKQQTVAEFRTSLDHYFIRTGEEPHIYRLCHSHRAACLEHVDQVHNDNVVVVDRPDCIMCN